VRLLDRLDRELGDGASLVAILDYDGTLTPLTPSPRQATLAPSVRSTLARLAASDRARLAILSGRGLADLRARVALEHVVYGGCHGLEIAGRHLRFRHPHARAARLRAARRALTASLASIPGARVEWKGLALSLHYRRVAPDRRPDVRDLATRIVRRGGVTLVPGHAVYDFVPRVAWNKGCAARWIVSRMAPTLPARPPLVLYAGDDTTDESAFLALRGRAVTICVGAKPTAAEYRVAGVRELQALLRRMASTMAS
jgi:trehalose-phosphatase